MLSQKLQFNFFTNLNILGQISNGKNLILKIAKLMKFMKVIKTKKPVEISRLLKVSNLVKSEHALTLFASIHFTLGKQEDFI